MEQDEIKALLEGAYAQMPTLPGFFVKYDELSAKFNELLTARGYQPLDLGEALAEHFPTARIEDNYVLRNEASSGPLRAVRITPNKLTATRIARNQIERALWKLSADDRMGWKRLDELDGSLDSSTYSRLGFTTLRSAVETLLRGDCEMRLVESDGSTAVMVRLTRPPRQRTVAETLRLDDQPARTPEEIRAKILLAFNNVEPSNVSGWKSFASLGNMLNRDEIAAMGFRNLREAVQTLCAGMFEYRKGDTSRHEEPLQVRLVGGGETADSSSLPPITHVARPFEATYLTGDRRLKQGSFIGRSIDAYAYFPKQKDTYGWDAAINNLAKLALYERWYYEERERLTKPILKNYLSYTFERLQYEDSVEREKATAEGRQPRLKILENNRYAVFNTGLVDKIYDPIYAFFKRNNGYNPLVTQPWVFVAFNTANSYHQDIITEFPYKPERAEYFTDPSELYYDCKANVPTLNWDHFLRDNIERLPMGFIRRGAPEGFQFASEPFAMPKQQREDYFNSLADAIFHDEMWRQTLTTLFKNALDMAISRAAWNYKVAIPIYHVDAHKISLLLPMALENRENIDVALVCEHIVDKERGVNNYIGRTIFTLKMAYNNARLITRPDTDWLAADMFARRRSHYEPRNNYQRRPYQQPMNMQFAAEPPATPAPEEPKTDSDFEPINIDF